MIYAQLVSLARKVVEAHDNNEWDERTRQTDLGDAIDELREIMEIDPPEREPLAEEGKSG